MAAIGLLMLVEINRTKLPKLDQQWANMTTSPFPTFVDTSVTLIHTDNGSRGAIEMQCDRNEEAIITDNKKDFLLSALAQWGVECRAVPQPF